ncbi:MAG: hypothetical protein ACI86S_000119 [Paracoccaceae bacterium]|jgi:hypothetical protein
MRFLFLGFITAALSWGNLSWACPDAQMMAVAQYTATGDMLTEGADFTVVAGGETDTGLCRNVGLSDAIYGHYFTTQPDVGFDLSSMDDFTMVLSVASDCDTMLMVLGASYFYYDDDDAGELQPRIVMQRVPNGAMQVWVGTFEAVHCDAVLTLETLRR